ncbi:hypothetical protein BsWGS_01846 [Bradybaena similaris]
MILSRYITLGISPFLGVLFAGPGMARGWGESIRWLQLQDAMHEAQMTQRPMMVIVHKDGCPACARVKPLFATHPGIISLSQYFAMVNLEANEVPRTSDFEPDGAYVPRILFFSPSGRVLTHIVGKEQSNRYYYDDMGYLAGNMQRVLQQYRQDA